MYAAHCLQLIKTVKVLPHFPVIARIIATHPSSRISPANVVAYMQLISTEIHPQSQAASDQFKVIASH